MLLGMKKNSASEKLPEEKKSIKPGYDTKSTSLKSMENEKTDSGESPSSEEGSTYIRSVPICTAFSSELSVFDMNMQGGKGTIGKIAIFLSGVTTTKNAGETVTLEGVAG